MMDELLTVCRFLAGGYFIWSGSSKMRSISEFWSQIMGYKITGAKNSRILAALLPPSEFVIGLLFAAGFLQLYTGILLLFMLSIFTVAILISLIRKTGNECGCSSSKGKVTPILLVRNGALAVLAVAGIMSSANEYIGVPFVAGCGVLIIFVISVNNFRSLGK